MKERQSSTPSQERVGFLKHPILAGKLLWTNKRISAAEKTHNQAKRIISLSQVPETAKREAVLNSQRSVTRLFELESHRKNLLKKAGKSDGSAETQTTTQKRSIEPGDDVFRGYDL